MGNGNKAEMLIAVCAVITSAIAVFIAWDQGRVMRAQQHGSVYPVLQAHGFVSSDPETRSMGIRFRNSGVGPALIESVEFYENGQKLESLASYRERLPEGYELSWTSMVGRAVAPGDEISALATTWPRDRITTAQHAAAAEDWSDLAMDVCYCSVFDRCWIAHTLADIRPTEPVRKCARSETDIFADLATVSEVLETKDPEGD